MCADPAATTTRCSSSLAWRKTFQVNPNEKADQREGNVVTSIDDADADDVKNVEVKKILKTDDKIEKKVTK